MGGGGEAVRKGCRAGELDAATAGGVVLCVGTGLAVATEGRPAFEIGTAVDAGFEVVAGTPAVTAPVEAAPVEFLPADAVAGI
jgi:hypothetical protein